MVLEVRVFNNNVEKAMRKLKRKVQREGLLKALNQRQFYEQPSLKRQRKLKEAMRNHRKLMKRREALN